MISRVAFASCYVYSPAGCNSICKRSRLLRALLKAGDAQFMRRYALRVRREVHQISQLKDYFLPQDVLVPVPGSAPKAGGTWVAAELAQALVLAGLGSKSWAGLRRVSAVRKSATAAQGARPTVALHYHSFAIEQPSFRADSLVLIDDVITKGRTLLAAAARVREAFPDAQIRAFALLRTMGLTAGVPRLSSPAEAKFAGEQGTRGEFREIQPQPYNAARLRIDLKTPPAGRPLQDLAPSAIAARLQRALAAADGLHGAHCIHELWMRGAMSINIERALEQLWACAAASIPEWLPMRYIDWLPTLYDTSLKFQSSAKGRSNIYLVLLDFSDRDGSYGVYVGMSKYSPAQRFDQHKAGIRAAGSVLKRGIEVLTGPTMHLQYIKRSEAARIEAQLAAALADAGLRVKGGH